MFQLIVCGRGYDLQVLYVSLLSHVKFTISWRKLVDGGTWSMYVFVILDRTTTRGKKEKTIDGGLLLGFCGAPVK